MVSAANSTNGVRLYTQVQMIKGVQYLRAAPVVEKSQTHYVLVARSEKLGGYVEIAPSCVGADRLTLKDVRERVAALEAAYKPSPQTNMQTVLLSQAKLRQSAAYRNQTQPNCVGGT